MAALTTKPKTSLRAPLEPGFSRYLAQINRFPVLKVEEERALAIRWREEGDSVAAHRLVTSHLRLVAKAAYGYRGYGLALPDLVSEGNIGLMKAVRNFDPYRGFRLSTYAIWWIRAAITEYVLKSWSIVKTGTVAARKKLFFGLRKIKNRLNIMDQGELNPKQVETISKAMDVPEAEVIDMNRRLGFGDLSLNATIGGDDNTEYIDILTDQKPGAEEELIQQDEHHRRQGWLKAALAELNHRERDILEQRKLSDDHATLQSLAHRYGISRERVRQIEVRAFRKLKKSVLQAELAAAVN